MLLLAGTLDYSQVFQFVYHPSHDELRPAGHERLQKRSVHALEICRSPATVPSSVSTPRAMLYAHGLRLSDFLSEFSDRYICRRTLPCSITGLLNALMSAMDHAPEKIFKAREDAENFPAVLAPPLQSDDALSTEKGGCGENCRRPSPFLYAN